MRKWLLLSVLAVGAANADIIPNMVTDPGAVTCAFDMGVNANVCTYQYTATIHSGTMVTGDSSDETDFFTIYDFNGYVPGSAVAPADWAVSAVDVAYTPALINTAAIDDGAIANLTFVYTGASDITDGRTITGFSAKSLYGPATITDWYGSQAHKQGDTPGGVVQNVGPVQVPMPPGNDPGVPEPMSMALLGGGLAALALLPRRFRK